MLVLVRTSNPGAADIEDLSRWSDASTVWERIAALVDELGAPGVGEAGLSDVGAVVGATAPGHLAARARADAGRDLPAPRRRSAGRSRRGPRAGVRARPRGRPGGGLAQHRRRPSDGGRGARGGGRAEAERLREAAWELCGSSVR